MLAKRLKIAPSILSADFSVLGEELRGAEEAGADIIHIDVMDGRFVPNITMGPLVVEAVRKVVSIPLDVHLMIVEPECFIDRFANAGADWITVHVEACTHLHRVLGQIANAGCRAGVALNPHTPASAISEIQDMVDLINVMTVNPGFGGQEFIATMTTKIQKLREMAQEKKTGDRHRGGWWRKPRNDLNRSRGRRQYNNRRNLPVSASWRNRGRH